MRKRYQDFTPECTNYSKIETVVIYVVINLYLLEPIDDISSGIHADSWRFVITLPV